MRAKKYLFCTLKQVSSSIENISNKLMLRAGMIRKLSSGIYIWLPTGLRILKKIKNIIRKEMKKIYFIELSIPIMQPIDLWKQSNRLIQYGEDLFTLIDRNKKNFILSPTSEEVITYVMKNEIKSYKDLPIKLFQIRTKFRDEIRPRFGTIRSREFIMKDGYSFHENIKSLKQTYMEVYNAYSKVFNKIGLKFKVVKANTGSMGGNISHEFQVISKSGEDDIVFSTQSNISANIELAQSIFNLKRPIPTKKITILDSIDTNNIKELAKNLDISLKKIVKTLIVKANKNSKYKLVALLIRGDHLLNIEKTEKISFISRPLEFVDEEYIQNIFGVKPEYIGPIGLNIPIISDYSVFKMSDFIVGSNIKNKYLSGVNWKRDLPEPNFIIDIKNNNAHEKNKSSRKDILIIKKGIEIGHIFQLGDKYSKSIKLLIQNKDGNNQEIKMGCYGIGITRIISAIIEQNHDNKGIIWPIDAIAPFTIAILPINLYNSDKVRYQSEYLYNILIKQGIDVIFDDRQENVGVMFSDMELIGVPHFIVISDRNIKNNIVEYKNRNNEIYQVNSNKILDFVKEKILVKNY